MPRVVANISSELKRWYQWQAVIRDSSMQDLLVRALEEFKENVGGDVPPLLTDTKGGDEKSKK